MLRVSCYGAAWRLAVLVSEPRAPCHALPTRPATAG